MKNQPAKFSLQGKVSLVTGGGRGLGRGIALALAEAGSDLLITARGQEQLAQSAADIASRTGVRVEVVQADLTGEGAPAALVDEALRRFGRLDVLVNNAGMNVRKPFLEMTPEDYRRVMDLNLEAVFFTSQKAAQEMASRGGGKIINLASLTSVMGIAGTSAYGASKGGVLALTKALAVELAPLGITVNAVAPGYVRTEMTEAAFQDQDRYAWMLSRIPLGRTATPQDIAGAVVFLACPAADYLNGEVIYVDGGWLAA
jgi:NAD(P)-dependent dehydrogenase (short-subunit alcohol dehydrogenase family)